MWYQLMHSQNKKRDMWSHLFHRFNPQQTGYKMATECTIICARRKEKRGLGDEFRFVMTFDTTLFCVQKWSEMLNPLALPIMPQQCFIENVSLTWISLIFFFSKPLDLHGMGIFQQHCMPHLQERSLLQPWIDEQLLQHVRLRELLHSYEQLDQHLRLRELLCSYAFSDHWVRMCFGFDHGLFFPPPLQDMGMIWLWQLFQYSFQWCVTFCWGTGCGWVDIILRGGPWWLRNDYTKTGCFILYKHWYIMSSLLCLLHWMNTCGR